MTMLEFFWDVGSPYSYLAATQLPRLGERTGATLRYRPLLLGGVFKAVGNQPPAALGVKQRYLHTDLARWRDTYEVPMRLPGEVPFPINTLLPMRVAMAAELAGQGERMCHALFAAYWGHGRDVSTTEELTRVIESLGLEPAELLAAAATPQVKDALRASTDEAVARGAFGAPTFFIGEDMYFGNDRLGFIEARLMA